MQGSLFLFGMRGVDVSPLIECARPLIECVEALIECARPLIEYVEALIEPTRPLIESTPHPKNISKRNQFQYVA
ncbi:hypothetical protein [Sporosarcina sp. PTS2304]|uniref:hypothetical protein n=1 Tax=Sporosarcina sp. PTS2304 TaxID=2283194 RepID=UPI0013B3B621|nr:hypothetical protein [Sporosarcina sp. PTS2304]